MLQHVGDGFYFEAQWETQMTSYIHIFHRTFLSNFKSDRLGLVRQNNQYTIRRKCPIPSNRLYLITEAQAFL